MYSIGQVARKAHVTIRTLRYYDQIGLLHPTAQTPAGYRHYSDADLLRLQHILCYRQLGFSLDAITVLLDDPHVDAVHHLRQQHHLLLGRIATLQAMADAVDKFLEAHSMGIELPPHETVEVFADIDPSAYHKEAEERWGTTAAWEEARQRTRRYRKDDWKQMQAEAQAILQSFAANQSAGITPDDTRTLALAEAHRQHIERWFYLCDHTMHRRLAEMYENDPRFAAHYNAVAPDLVTYVAMAIRTLAEQYEG